MKIKPKKNLKAQAWEDYKSACRIANELRDKTVREAEKKYRECLICLENDLQPPDNQ